MLGSISVKIGNRDRSGRVFDKFGRAWRREIGLFLNGGDYRRLSDLSQLLREPLINERCLGHLKVLVRFYVLR